MLHMVCCNYAAIHKCLFIEYIARCDNAWLRFYTHFGVSGKYCNKRAGNTLKCGTQTTFRLIIVCNVHSCPFSVSYTH